MRFTTFLLLCLLSHAAHVSLVQATDLVLGNAKVCTVDSPQWAEAVAIDEDGIIGLGSGKCYVARSKLVT